MWREKPQTKMKTFMNKFIKEMRALKNKTSKELCAKKTNIETQKNLRIEFWLESSREKEKTQIKMKAFMNKCAKKMKTSTCERVVAQQEKLTCGMMIVFNFTILVQHHEQGFAIVD